MNELTNKPKNKPNQKVLYKAIAVSLVVVFFGGMLDSSEVFGEQAHMPIIMTVSVFTGVAIGIAFCSVKTGLTIKELVI